MSELKMSDEELVKKYKKSCDALLVNTLHGATTGYDKIVEQTEADLLSRLKRGRAAIELVEKIKKMKLKDYENKIVPLLFEYDKSRKERE